MAAGGREGVGGFGCVGVESCHLESEQILPMVGGSFGAGSGWSGVIHEASPPSLDVMSNRGFHQRDFVGGQVEQTIDNSVDLYLGLGDLG